MVSAWTIGGSFSVTSPFGLLITRPAAVSSEARRGRTRKVMSRPACSILPPKYPPMAPAPTMRTRISQFLLLLDTRLSRTLLIRGSRVPLDIYIPEGAVWRSPESDSVAGYPRGTQCSISKNANGHALGGIVASTAYSFLAFARHVSTAALSVRCALPRRQRNVLSVGSGRRTCGFPTV